MHIFGSLFGWVPDIISEWGLYGVLLAIVGLLTEVTILGGLLMLAFAAVTRIFSYFGELGGAFSRKRENRWDLLGYGIGVALGLVLVFFVIGPSGIADAGTSFTWGSWVVAIAGGIVAAVGLLLNKTDKKNNALSFVGAVLLAAGIVVAILYLADGAIDVSDNAILF